MCQHKYLNELGTERRYLNLLKYIIVNIIFKYRKNKRASYKENLIRNIDAKSIIPEAIYPGDIVQIKSKEDILQTLDFHGKHKRCQFMDEMYNYCEKKFKVMKRVDNFYDAVLRKECACKDLYILEGLTCQGRKGIPYQICDLDCNFFWHRNWLTKI